jgi:hypothetical protein
MTPSGCTRQPGTGVRSVVTAPITTPSRSSRAEWSWSSIRISNRTPSNVVNTPVEPRRHRIGVDRHRNSRSCTFTSAHLRQCLGLQQRCLRGQSQQRDTGSRCRTGLFPHHQHLAHPLLERLDPLAHRRRCDMQPLRCRIKAAELYHRREGSKLLTVHIHISNANV